MIGENPAEISIESVRDNWEDVITMDKGSDSYGTIQEDSGELMSKLAPYLDEPKDEDATVESEFDPEAAIGFTSEEFEFNYSFKDLIRYALSVGVSLGESAFNDGLNLLYENSEGFSALSSFGVLPGLEGLAGLVSGAVPGLNIDLSKV